MRIQQIPSSTLKFLILVVLVCASTALHAESRYIMGTTLEIKLCSENETKRDVIESAFQIAQDLDDKLSNYKESSEISELNRNAFLHPVKVSADTIDILKRSIELSKATCGYFDVTVLPALRYWENLSKEGRSPRSEEIEEVLKTVGHENLTINLEEQTVRFKRKGVEIDTGGIGKGFAVDRIMAFFRKKKVNCALINFGHSSIAAIGNPPDNNAWKLALQFPGDRLEGVVSLKDIALSGSGALSQPLPIKEKQYGKIINPLTGTPLHVNKKSVILSKSGTVAEALSKAVLLKEGKCKIDEQVTGRFEYAVFEDNTVSNISEGFKKVFTINETAKLG